MKIHYFQHVAFETPDGIAEWAQTGGHTLTGTRFDLGERPPQHDEIDLLVVMGGPMSVGDTEQYPWLEVEKRYIAQAIGRNSRVLGVCLGAQLIADVLGARVFANRHKEIGWYPVTLTDAGRQDPLFREFPSEFPAFHWHGDTFELPAGAAWLAASAACAHQAFRYGPHVVGLQFHLELSLEGVQRLIQHCGSELQPAPHIQTAAQMLHSSEYPASRVRVGHFLTQLTDRRDS
jgi:GMP synthase-like glutamine amidotransferase